MTLDPGPSRLEALERKCVEQHRTIVALLTVAGGHVRIPRSLLVDLPLEGPAVAEWREEATGDVLLAVRT